ncbi:auxin-responsive protein SAUR50 [Selaginella moellendorffii]|nr:auxin-responsive protein SAUR50 [Selaginella moellendorffii]|eukprot:XP_024529842.1 auxin-responsive protein SAUR50 [Selaginella moellendorffii]
MAKLVSILRKALPSSKLPRSYSSNGSSSGFSSDSSSDCEGSLNFAPPNVPQGSFAVYAGEERHRFLVRMEHLNHPLFRALLEKAAEEYGFDHAGALSIPCEAVLFEHVLWLLNNNDAQARHLELDELLQFYSS